MGNCIPLPLEFSSKKKQALPIETIFKFPSPLPAWPSSGQRFAVGSINLGELEVCQVSTFTKVWSALEGGEDNLGATFFKPAQVPNGFWPLGCYCQANNKPLFGWILAGKGKEDDNGGPLRKPEDYSLVWSSQSLKFKQDGICCVWLPTPPQGYSAVGYIVTNSPEKPSLDEMRCVRSDFTEPCEKETKLWELGKGSDDGNISFYSTRPATRGIQAPGICAGTFIAEVEGASMSSSIVCLKNKSPYSLSMPNIRQIEALMQTYAPWIYFHPEETYLPSSVSWFFSNGALLYKQGNPTPSQVDATGSNLPQGGSNDGAYWLDLPTNEEAREKVKKGDLQSSECYLHVKPMLGATFTDLVIWVFYPFNGPARAKIGLLTVPLGKIGEHVGDWEHVTLRISNFTGELWRVYISEHSAGKWIDASELEFQGGNKVVTYASLNGHAFYSKPGLVLQGSSQLEVGIRNDTAKGKAKMDIGPRFVVVGAEYLDSVVEPPWLNYEREWGPKITYNTGERLNKVEKLLPGELRAALEKLVNDLPGEVLGEEGPTGPKVKSNWNGDEI